MAVIFSILAIFIASPGLFCLTSFTVELIFKWSNKTGFYI
jgi:hypothetical protein